MISHYWALEISDYVLGENLIVIYVCMTEILAPEKPRDSGMYAIQDRNGK